MTIKDIITQHFEKRRKQRSQENMYFFEIHGTFFEILLKFSVQLSVSITQCSMMKITFFAK